MVPHLGHTAVTAVVAVVMASVVRAGLACLAVVGIVVVTATGGVVPVGGEVHAAIGHQRANIEREKYHTRQQVRSGIVVSVRAHARMPSSHV